MPFRPGSEGRPPRFVPRPHEEEAQGEEKPAAEPRRFSPWRGERPLEAVPTRPSGEPVIPELHEIMLPERELKEPGFRYRTLWETIPPSVYQPTIIERPRGEEPRRPEGARPEAPRRREAAPAGLDPGRYFNLGGIWDLVSRLRRDSRFQAGKAYAIFKVLDPTRSENQRLSGLIDYFKLRDIVSQYAGEDVWGEVLGPFLDDLSQALNRAKPREIPGEFGFQPGKDGSFWLGYME